MNSIFAELLDAVDEGRKFKVDLINKSLWIDRKKIIEKGEIVNEQYQGKELIKKYDLTLHFGIDSCLPPWELLELIFNEFEKSVPSKHTVKTYFKAKSVDELTDVDLAYNYDRIFMTAMLEGYILLASLKGILKWQNDKHWFWQSERNKNFIVLKSYIE